ncbi:MAG: glycosyltransferase family 4 protein [Planctomycetes bacterium]|nr:glycosyltransferase family 4 protein [Planctomycetota bacterium]
MRVLHLLSQRPGLTGSGVTLEALIREGTRAGHEQAVSFATPFDAPVEGVGGLRGAALHPLTFGDGERPYPVPGMSDVMPYPSTRFAAMGAALVQRYRDDWYAHLRRVIGAFRPDVIHAHHLWLMTAALHAMERDVPVVMHGHGTDLRQLDLCPDLVDEVVTGCREHDALCVLHEEHARLYAARYGIDPERIAIVGSGYRDDVFHPRGRAVSPSSRVLYAGKLSDSKGVPALLAAIERLVSRFVCVTLEVAGGGSGEESDRILARIAALGPHVRYLGRLDQMALADRLRAADVFVLPSYYEGLPLVLVEALACGCRLVCSDLPGVRQSLAPRLGDALQLVSMPRMASVDRPVEDDVPAFVERLADALETSLARPPLELDSLEARLAPFGWSRVFQSVERVWTRVRFSGK